MMDTLIIQSTESNAKLTLFNPTPKNINNTVNGFSARLESHKIPVSECEVFGAEGEYLYAFFKSIVNSNEPSNYYSLEDHIIIDAKYENNSIELNVKLREGPWEEDWQVEEKIILNKNAYIKAVSNLSIFLRLKYNK